MSQDFKAIRFHEYGGSDKLVLETLNMPTLKPNEVLIEVRFAGVNPIDWKIRSGYLKDFMPISFPFTPGIDVSGVIAEVGAEVKGFKKGQSVFGIGNGTYAQFVVAAEGDIILKPDNLSFDMAASVPVGALTAWKAIADAGVKKDDTLVILGASGGVGSYAVQFAALRGAKVIGTSSDKNLSYLISLGAKKAVDYKNAARESELANADIIIDTVGGDTLDRAYGLLKKGGTLVTVAGQVSEDKAKEHGVTAIASGRGPSSLLSEISGLLAKRKIVAEVGTVYPLANAREAQDQCETGHGRGRILLEA